MQRYNVNSPSGKWYMTTDLNGLRNVFRLAREALTRVENETADGGTCKLHFSRQTPWGSNEYWITRAE